MIDCIGSSPDHTSAPRSWPSLESYGTVRNSYIRSNCQVPTGFVGCAFHSTFGHCRRGSDHRATRRFDGRGFDLPRAYSTMPDAGNCGGRSRFVDVWNSYPRLSAEALRGGRWPAAAGAILYPSVAAALAIDGRSPSADDGSSSRSSAAVDVSFGRSSAVVDVSSGRSSPVVDESSDRIAAVGGAVAPAAFATLAAGAPVVRHAAGGHSSRSTSVGVEPLAAGGPVAADAAGRDPDAAALRQAEDAYLDLVVVQPVFAAVGPVSEAATEPASRDLRRPADAVEPAADRLRAGRLRFRDRVPEQRDRFRLQ